MHPTHSCFGTGHGLLHFDGALVFLSLASLRCTQNSAGGLLACLHGHHIDRRHPRPRHSTVVVLGQPRSHLTLFLIILKQTVRVSMSNNAQPNEGTLTEFAGKKAKARGGWGENLAYHPSTHLLLLNAGQSPAGTAGAHLKLPSRKPSQKRRCVADAAASSRTATATSGSARVHVLNAPSALVIWNWACAAGFLWRCISFSRVIARNSEFGWRFTCPSRSS
jgi:hypothetical protein